MMKQLGLCLSICLATLFGNYYYLNFSSKADETRKGGSGHADAAPLMAETELLAAPVISGGLLQGFFFVRVAYSVNVAEIKGLGIPMDLIIDDSFYFYVANNPSYRFPELDEIDVAKLVDGIKSSANELAGRPVVENVYLSQVDFFSSKDVRKKSIERRQTLKSADVEKPKPAHAEAAAH